MNALVIDDDIFTRKAIAFQLLEMGNTVTAVTGGQEALEIIDGDKDFGLVVCDIMMPGLTGAGFLLALRQRLRGKMPAIIVVTGVKDAPQLLRKVEVKYDYLFAKPVDFDSFARAVREISSKKD
jgi:CheY-like chemotaxis protein